MGFPRQEYWSGLPFPSPGDLPDPGIKPVSPVGAGRFFTTEPPGKPMRSSVQNQGILNLALLSKVTVAVFFIFHIDKSILCGHRSEGIMLILTLLMFGIDFILLQSVT